VIHQGFSGPLLPGQHAIPFSVTLPLGIPATLQYHDDDIALSVAYVMSAKLLKQEGGDLLRSRIFPIVVFDPSGPPPPQASTKASQGRSNWCCCFNIGSVSLSVTLDRVRYDVRADIIGMFMF
jgi:hypothetical protein